MNLEQLREYCLSLPGTTEDVKWGNDLCFCIGGKMYCVASLDGAPGASFKTTAEEFDHLTALKNVIPAPYLARHKWVNAQEWKTFSANEWKRLIQQSWRLVREGLPARVKKMLPA